MKTLFLFSLMVSSLYLQQATYCMDGAKTALAKETSQKDSYQNEKLPQQQNTPLASHKKASESYQSLSNPDDKPESPKKSFWQTLKQNLSLKKSDESSSSYTLPEQMTALIFQPR